MRAGQKVATAWINSEQADNVAKYYALGHTVSDTARHFGVSKHQVNNLVKLRGITNGRKWGEPSDTYKESVRRKAEQKLVNRLDLIGFDYCGGYTNKAGKVTLKCRTCGDAFERTAGFAMRGNVICKKCEHEKTLSRQEERRKAREIEMERRKAECKARPPVDYYAEQHEALLNIEGVCEICGKPYTVREYVESCGLKYARDNGVCSEKCRRVKVNRQVRESRKRRGIHDNHRARAKKYGCEYDSSITLNKLIARDGLRCAICGEMCDTNDRRWSEYAGPMYPSIDHIIPMSRGGGHTWDNLQITHMICNSFKGDKMIE